MIGSLFVTGPAGTGKSSFCASLKEWLTMQGYDAAIVNLDPGADYIPYEAEIDVRDIISISDVMSEYSLGPNGAQVVAADLIVENVEELTTRMEEFPDYYFIFDTPGQIELFSFRPGSRLLVDKIGMGKSMLAFLADAILAQSASGYISQKMLYGSVMSRFFNPMLFVVNKVDLIGDESVEQIRKWENDPDSLEDDFLRESTQMLKDYYQAVVRSFREIELVSKLFLVSSQEMTGFEDIYSEMSLFFKGGEDVDTFYKDD